MRVIIHENADEHHDIKIPTGLALNRVTTGILSKFLQTNGVNIEKKQLFELIKAAKKYKKNHPDWKLVEVDDSGGEHIEIIL